MTVWLKKEEFEEYNESSMPFLACAGKRFVLMTEQQFVRFAGDLGINIFNAMKEKVAQDSACRGFFLCSPFFLLMY